MINPRGAPGIMEAAIGSMFVKRHFKDEAKELATEMSEVLRYFSQTLIFHELMIPYFHNHTMTYFC